MADKQQLVNALLNYVQMPARQINAMFAGVPGKIKTAYDQSQTPDFKEHATWYEGQLPSELDKYAYGQNGLGAIGTLRTEGSPRDAAAEFAGAADWGTKSKDYDQALFNAKLHQYKSNPLSPKNRSDAITQDQAGLEWAKANPNATRRQIIEQAIKYAQQNDFGVGPQYNTDY